MNATLTRESGGWLRMSQRRADLDGLSGRQLLNESRDLPDNARFARDGSATVLISDDYERLDEPSGNGHFDEATIEMLLAEHSPAFTKREERWIVPPTEERGVELTVEQVAGGVLVKAALVDTSDASAIALDALGEFLCRAHLGLRFVRAELTESHACVMARADAGRLETDLPHALRAAAAAARLLVREASALLQPELAEAYLKNLQAS